jgi:hypothetical protein
MEQKTWISTSEAAEMYNCSQRYINMLITGRTRRKKTAVWTVKPKLSDVKITVSSKGKQKFFVNKQEIEKFFNKMMENPNV